MIHRFQALSSSQKVFAISASILFIMIGIITASVFIRNDSDSSAIQNPPVKFEYCDANPKELCVLSFGRSGAGNTIINFFVPNKSFPEFYLIVKKTGTESGYECRKSVEIKTSVFCIGEPLSLKQTIEINILANKDNQLLATGKFFIEAFLISTQGVSATPESFLTNENLQTQDISTKETPTVEISTTVYPDPSVYPYP